MTVTTIPILVRGSVAGAAVLLLAACAQLEVPDVPGAPQPAPPGQATARVETPTAAPGQTVQVRGSGYPANTAVEIGLGQPESEYTVVRTANTDAQGAIATVITVPDWAMRGHPYVVVVNVPGAETRVVTDAFVVGSPGDSVTVEGTLTDDGVECPALRGRSGALYTLATRDLEFGPGTEVRVRGTIAGASICMQGTTLEVESIERR